MQIGKVSSWLLRVPHRLPLAREDEHVTFNFIEVETNDGLKGYAMAAYPMRHGIREYINREAAATMKGMDPLRPEEVRMRLRQLTAGKQYHGAWACAISLIDIALWDIKGKALKQPIWKLLGGARSEVPAYITFGFQHYNTEELIEVAKMYVKEGQTGLKMVVAAGPYMPDGIRRPVTDASIRGDAERVRAVREAIGPDIDLMMDANQGLSLPQAVRLARLCEPHNLTWFEDAVTQSDPRLMARLRRQCAIPLAAGSTATSDLVHLREYLLHDAVDYLQPNVRDIGGYTQALKAAGMAQASNVPIAMGGNYPHLNMHLHAGVANGGRIEYHMQGWKCYEAVFDGTPPPVQGITTLPTAPGLGFTPKAGILDLAID